jgi:hypothetical protein
MNTHPPPDRTRAAGAALFCGQDPLHRETVQLSPPCHRRLLSRCRRRPLSPDVILGFSPAVILGAGRGPTFFTGGGPQDMGPRPSLRMTAGREGGDTGEGVGEYRTEDPIHRDRSGPSRHEIDGFLTCPRAADRFAWLRGDTGHDMRRGATVPRSRDPAAPAFTWFGSSPAPGPRGGAHGRRILARKTSYTVSRCRHGRSDHVRPVVATDRTCSKALCNVKTGGTGHHRPGCVHRTGQWMTNEEWRQSNANTADKPTVKRRRPLLQKTPCNVNARDSGCRRSVQTAVRRSTPRRAT